MKLYWNAEYPECLYCMAKSHIEEDMLYVLIYPNNVVERVRWTETTWGTAPSQLKENCFEFIGKL